MVMAASWPSNNEAAEETKRKGGLADACSGRFRASARH